ncbi:MAG: hypothetical protein LLG93_04930 [Deltaproteobacteria bacterium]|nr:hypothetical protein [Deltaproteobacteria bacterium]
MAGMDESTTHPHDGGAIEPEKVNKPPKFPSLLGIIFSFPVALDSGE